MFPVRYGLNSYINLLRNSFFKGLIIQPYKAASGRIKLLEGTVLCPPMGSRD
jgi:hypothetical protein